MRILLLEDDPILRDTVAEALEDEGYLVTPTGRGLDAVEAARRHRFDLMITDIRMEGMDGLEALERVRQLQPGVCSLVVSGYACDEDLRRVTGSFLKKPYALGDLLDRVARLQPALSSRF